MSEIELCLYCGKDCTESLIEVYEDSYEGDSVYSIFCNQECADKYFEHNLDTK